MVNYAAQPWFRRGPAAAPLAHAGATPESGEWHCNSVPVTRSHVTMPAPATAPRRTVDAVATHAQYCRPITLLQGTLHLHPVVNSKGCNHQRDDTTMSATYANLGLQPAAGERDRVTQTASHRRLSLT
jgi:hypothetical protein